MEFLDKVRKVLRFLVAYHYRLQWEDGMISYNIGETSDYNDYN